MSKPKLNHQLNSTEFEVRLHSYTEVHPTTPHSSLLILHQSGKKRAFIYESSGKTVCRNLVEVVGGVH